MQQIKTATAWVAAVLVVAMGLCGVRDASAGDRAASPAPDWAKYLKRGSIERVQISPDGTRLAVAERADDRTFVTIRALPGLEVLKRFDPGDGGELHRLRWLDDKRLLVAANAVIEKYGVAFNPPVMAIVNADGSGRYMLPANFLATIEGDLEHLLVYKCTNGGFKGCHDAVHKVEIGHLSRTGEPIVTAPDVDSVLYSDRYGKVRFSASVEDNSDSRLHVHNGSAWALVNDSTESGLHVSPVGVDHDGKSGFLLAERKSGPSVVERYEFATGTRTEVYRHAWSDPVETLFAFDGLTPVGAYYGATSPRAVIWNAAHPDAQAVASIAAAFPGRRIGVTSATADRNRVVVFTRGDRDPGTWYLYDRAANKASVLARSNAWLSEADLPQHREVVLQARDGVELRGLLTLPSGATDKQLPMVVVPHGGPHGMVDESGFSAEAAILASRGYAVLRVNFRGSGGQGREFEHSGYMQWGRAMQDDVTDATRWAIAQGIADPARICIYGWSYGGYAALMGAAREPSLYRCAVGAAGPYDLNKMYRWGSIRNTDYGKEYLARVIGKDKAVLTERSPTTNAAAIKVPVLIVHGRLDARVDVAHARRMVNALEKAGVDVSFQEYMKAGHGLALEADEVDFYTRLLAFLDKYMGTAKVAARSASR